MRTLRASLIMTAMVLALPAGAQDMVAVPSEVAATGAQAGENAPLPGLGDGAATVDTAAAGTAAGETAAVQDGQIAAALPVSAPTSAPAAGRKTDFMAKAAAIMGGAAAGIAAFKALESILKKKDPAAKQAAPQ